MHIEFIAFIFLDGRFDLVKLEINMPDSGVFHDEVEIEDFEFDDDTQTYTYPCPCGDRFEISLSQVRERLD
jgi:hypothetical protein